MKDARVVLEAEEADKLIDHDEIARHAIELTEQSGIIFLDEMDKIARSEGSGSQPTYPEKAFNEIYYRLLKVQRCQRSMGQPKRTSFFFIAAGAFHIAKPSDIIPELTRTVSDSSRTR